MKVACKGYLFNDTGSQGEPTRRTLSCPELDRRRGIKPGGRYSYPDDWNMECPTCKNTAETDLVPRKAFR